MRRQVVKDLFVSAVILVIFGVAMVHVIRTVNEMPNFDHYHMFG